MTIPPLCFSFFISECFMKKLIYSTTRTTCTPLSAALYDYDITFAAIELSEQGMKGAEFAAKNGFKEDTFTVNNNHLVLNDDFYLEYSVISPSQ